MTMDIHEEVLLDRIRLEVATPVAAPTKEVLVEIVATLVVDRTRDLVALRANCPEETTDTLAMSQTTVDQDIKLIAHCHRNEHSPHYTTRIFIAICT